MARSTKQLSITLPIDMAEEVASKVAAGEYASESEVIREGLRTLWARNQAVDRWLQSEVAATYDALQADPSLVVTPKDLRARLAKLHARTSDQT